MGNPYWNKVRIFMSYYLGWGSKDTMLWCWKCKLDMFSWVKLIVLIEILNAPFFGPASSLIYLPKKYPQTCKWPTMKASLIHVSTLHEVPTVRQAGSYEAFWWLASTYILCFSSSLKYPENSIWCKLPELFWRWKNPSLPQYGWC